MDVPHQHIDIPCQSGSLLPISVTGLSDPDQQMLQLASDTVIVVISEVEKSRAIFCVSVVRGNIMLEVGCF